MNLIDVSTLLERQLPDSKYITLPFYKNGLPLTEKNSKQGRNVKNWGMTVLAGGTMRFRWNETNENRNSLLKEIVKKEYPNTCSGKCVTPGGDCDCRPQIVPLELIHSKIVYKVKAGTETHNLQGDGMITDNRLLMPVVTVADCVPVFFYDDVKGVFGVVHSGWKGTGIIGEAISKAVNDYGSRLEDICVAIGPHIGDCCYFVDETRAQYFTENFGNKCITKIDEEAGEKPVDGLGKPVEADGLKLNYRLSLTEANLYVIRKAGISEQNITVAKDCTCCTTFSNKKNIFGSFRRQAAFLSGNMTTEERSKKMTVQAAFVI